MQEWEAEREDAQPHLTIEQLVAMNCNNPQILPELEDHVQEQVETQTYSLEANLCLLRLYQFDQKKLNPDLVTKVLVKALMALPGQDFNLCMFLLPDKLQTSEPFITLATLSHFLETGRFREFWDEAAKNRDILEVVPGFEEAIQRFGIHVLSLTYQRVPRAVLAETINVEGVELDKFIEYHKWKVQKGPSGGQVVVLPLNEFNAPSLKKNAADNVSVEAVAKLLPILV